MQNSFKILKEKGDMQPERRSIRLEGPCSQAGVAAALRRAFDNPARVQSIEDEFDRLLARVH